MFINVYPILSKQTRQQYSIGLESWNILHSGSAHSSNLAQPCCQMPQLPFFGGKFWKSVEMWCKHVTSNLSLQKPAATFGTQPLGQLHSVVNRSVAGIIQRAASRWLQNRCASQVSIIDDYRWLQISTDALCGLFVRPEETGSQFTLCILSISFHPLHPFPWFWLVPKVPSQDGRISLSLTDRVWAVFSSFSGPGSRSLDGHILINLKHGKVSLFFWFYSQRFGSCLEYRKAAELRLFETCSCGPSRLPIFQRICTLMWPRTSTERTDTNK